MVCSLYGKNFNSIETISTIILMTTIRPWRWDLEETRSAAVMEPEQSPVVSGFTPINQPKPVPTTLSRSGANAMPSKPKAEVKAKVYERRKSQPSTTVSKVKLGKASRMKQVKRSKTAGELQCEDISKDLLRKKPPPSGNSTLLDKTTALDEDAVQQSTAHTASPPSGLTVVERFGNNDPAKFQLRPSGLADRYQAAYATVSASGINPSVLNINDSSPPRTLAGDDGDDNFIEHAGNAAWVESILNCNVDANRTSTTPASLTLPKATPEADSSGKKAFAVGDELEDYPMADEDYELIARSGLVMEGLEDDEFDWRSQDFAGDTSIPEDLDHENLQQATLSPRSNDASMHRDQSPLLSNGPVLTSSHLQCSDPSNTPAQTSANFIKHCPYNMQTPGECEDCFDDADLEEDLENLVAHGSGIVQLETPRTSPAKPSSPKLQWLPPKAYTPAKSCQVPLSPVETPCVVPLTKYKDTVPFTRPPFPKTIRDRSPILGLSNRTVLRTCFRIGEALNAATVASRNKVDAMIELYARINSSTREGFKQFFQFGDLFTDKPPYLRSTSSVWKGVELWEHDSRPFLGDEGKGRMARVMGKIKRCEQGGGFEMTVLSIWEIDWEDIEVAKGIVCS